VPAEVEMAAWHLYEQRKAQFLRDHPDASSDDLEALCRLVAEELGL
jgi:hypothetical protein